MTKRRIIQVVLVFLPIVLVVLGVFHFHVLGASVQDGVLLWNSDEAYLFLAWGRSGYHFTGFEYLFSHVPAYFGVPRTVDDNRLSMLVVKITPTAVERHVTEPYQMYRGFLTYIPRNKTIYAYDGGAMLWKWAGTRFDTVSLDELKKLALDQNSLTSEKDYTNVDGWSSRHSLTTWPSTTKIELQGKPVTLFLTSKDSGQEISLDIQLPDGARQSVVRTNRKFHLVSKSEYESTFKAADRAQSN